MLFICMARSFKSGITESDDRTKEKIRTLLRESASFIVLGEKWNKAIHDIEPKTKTVVVRNTVPVPNIPLVGMKKISISVPWCFD